MLGDLRNYLSTKKESLREGSFLVLNPYSFSYSISLLFLHNFFTKLAREKQQMDTKGGYNKSTVKREESDEE